LIFFNGESLQLKIDSNIKIGYSLHMKWTNEDKTKLAYLVVKNTVNGRIAWIKVGKALKRTAN
jgi:hypothetical protein